MALAPAPADPIHYDASGQIGRIPVRNLWLLMLYASELYREINQRKIAVDDNLDDIADLVAEILTRAVKKRLHRNLSFGYREREEELNRVRGRIDLLQTEQRQLLRRGKVACRFEKLTVDTQRNRLVLAALRLVAGLVSRRDLAHRCRKFANCLQRLGVSNSRPTRAEASMERFGRNDAEDRSMVAAAQLALDMALPTEGDGSHFLVSPDREEGWVRTLFEKAVCGFYDVVLSTEGWRVHASKRLSWQIPQQSAGIGAILPSMITDIVLDHISDGRRIVIDTKFTSILKKGRFRAESLRSGYVYQIYAYLMSQNGTQDPLSQVASGLMLHPSIGATVNEVVVIQGRSVRFGTVDLAASAAVIRSQLLSFVNSAQVKDLLVVQDEN